MANKQGIKSRIEKLEESESVGKEPIIITLIREVTDGSNILETHERVIEYYPKD